MIKKRTPQKRTAVHGQQGEAKASLHTEPQKG